MLHTKTHDSGAEEWYCPECGRRFLLNWPPNYSQVILEPGDESVLHTGGKDGMQMAEMDASQATDFLNELTPCSEDEQTANTASSAQIFAEDAARLNRWDELLTEIGFDEWWQ